MAYQYYFIPHSTLKTAVYEPPSSYDLKGDEKADDQSYIVEPVKHSAALPLQASNVISVFSTARRKVPAHALEALESIDLEAIMESSCQPDLSQRQEYSTCGSLGRRGVMINDGTHVVSAYQFDPQQEKKRIKSQSDIRRSTFDHMASPQSLQFRMVRKLKPCLHKSMLLFPVIL